MVYVSASYLIHTLGIPKNALFQKTARAKTGKVMMENRAFFDVLALAKLFPEFSEDLFKIYHRFNQPPIDVYIHGKIQEVEINIFLRDEQI